MGFALLRIEVISILKPLALVLPVLVSVAFMTLAERKVLSLIGFRQGPNKISVQGILQPIADAIKLSNKSANYLSNYSLLLYYLSVGLMIVLSLIAWSSLVFIESFINWKFSLLAIMIMLGLSSIKSILSGWSTYGKYPLIGRIRTVSQIISYESVLYLCLLAIVWLMKSFRLSEIQFQSFYLSIVLIPLVSIFWVPSILAELNRTPYDFSEGERELVRGFNTEFGSSSFTIIFLSEYRNIIFFIVFTTMLFLNGRRVLSFIVFLIFINFWVIWMRRTLPRIRFDKFIIKAWKIYIPFITLVFIVLSLEI